MTDYYIDKGKVRQDMVIAMIRALDDGKRWKVSITEAKSKRSLEQNSYFHLLVDLFADHSGYTPKEAKDTLKAECARAIPYRMLDGRTGTRPQSTREMSVQEMMEFIERVIHVLIDEVGLRIPPKPWHDQ